jgi:PAS domain S-box-containing protein
MAADQDFLNKKLKVARKRISQLEELKLAQSRLAAIVENADDAIISKTLDGTVTSWNQAAEKLYGYTAEEIIGKPVTVLFPLERSEEETRILERLRRGERVEHYETQRLRKDGRLVDVSVSVAPIRDSKGGIVGASNISRDITEAKRSAQRERQALEQAQFARRQAEAASRAKDDFLATVSHELRTPLTAILGWVRMLATGELDAGRQSKAIEIIDRNARTQAQLIEDLLDISRITSGKLRIAVRSVDFAAVISAATEAVRPAADAKEIRIRSQIDSSAGPILGDFDRLQQVVWNLLSNAIRFTPRGGLVKIEVKHDDSIVELSVTDTGAGISKDFLPYVFDRFSQADSSITRVHGGLGMGLAIVRAIVELHGGTVAATSAGEGKGSTFTVRLPLSGVHRGHGEAAAGSTTLTADALGDERPELAGLRILVVDDDVDTCEMLHFLFERSGAIVRVAGSAIEALRIFDEWAPDVLVCDIGMPDVDGYELIRRIRYERKSKVPAVALTALARVEDRVKALRAGFQMHVAKPIEPTELVSIVASLAGLADKPAST